MRYPAFYTGDTHPGVRFVLRTVDENGKESALDLTGYTVEARIIQRGDGASDTPKGTTWITCTVEDAVNGVVSFPISDATLLDTAGVYYVLFRLTTGSYTYRLRSEDFYVAEAPA